MRTLICPQNWSTFYIKNQVLDRAFSYSVSPVTYDIKKLKNEYRLLTKFKLSTTAINQLADQIQDLRDQLLTISSYVKTHREYRKEARYYEIASRVR